MEIQSQEKEVKDTTTQLCISPENTFSIFPPLRCFVFENHSLVKAESVGLVYLTGKCSRLVTEALQAEELVQDQEIWAGSIPCFGTGMFG